MNNIGHFFAAYRVDGFRALDEFKQDMDEFVRTLRSCPPQDGVRRVLLPGEKEYEASKERGREGIPLHHEVANKLRMIATEYGLESVV